MAGVARRWGRAGDIEIAIADVMDESAVRRALQGLELAGHAYWRSISPFHGVVFGGMLKNITAAAERAERAGSTPRPHLA